MLRLGKLGTDSKLSGMVHKITKLKKKKVYDGNIPRHELIQQKFARVRRAWTLNNVCPLRASRSRRSRYLDRYLLDGLRRLGMGGGHQRRSNIHRGVAGGTGDSAEEREQNVCLVIGIRWWRSGRGIGRTAAWDGVERAGGGRSRV